MEGPLVVVKKMILYVGYYKNIAPSTIFKILSSLAFGFAKFSLIHFCNF